MTRQRGSTPAERRAGPKSRLPPAGPRAALEQLRDMAAALLPACVRVSPALPSPPGGHRGLWGGSRGPSRRLPYSPAGAEKGRRRAGPEGSPAAPPAPALPEGRATSCGPGAWRGHRRLRQGPREEARPAAVVRPGRCPSPVKSHGRKKEAEVATEACLLEQKNFKAAES